MQKIIRKMTEFGDLFKKHKKRKKRYTLGSSGKPIHPYQCAAQGSVAAGNARTNVSISSWLKNQSKMAKDLNRIKRYKQGTNDFAAEYNMLLDDGITCNDCIHCIKCCSMFGQKETDTSCQFYPNRFILKKSK